MWRGAKTFVGDVSEPSLSIIVCFVKVHLQCRVSQILFLSCCATVQFLPTDWKVYCQRRGSLVPDVEISCPEGNGCVGASNLEWVPLLRDSNFGCVGGVRS